MTHPGPNLWKICSKFEKLQTHNIEFLQTLLDSVLMVSYFFLSVSLSVINCFIFLPICFSPSSYGSAALLRALQLDRD